VTNGFRSEWGAKVYADLCSVVATGRQLALVVGRLDVAARLEHQQLVARRHGDGGTQVAALDIGRLEVQQTIVGVDELRQSYDAS
jgi:hypothetical protein